MIPVPAKLPLPMSVTRFVPLTIAPNVNSVTPPPTGLLIAKVGDPLSVVAPNVRPAVALFTLPPPTVRVFAPMARVPRV